MPNEGLLQKYIHQTININKQIKSNTYIEYIKCLHGQIAEIKTIPHIHALRSKTFYFDNKTWICSGSCLRTTLVSGFSTSKQLDLSKEVGR